MATQQLDTVSFDSLWTEPAKKTESNTLEGRKLTELCRNGKPFTVRSGRFGPYRYFGEAFHVGIDLEGQHYGLSVPDVPEMHEVYVKTAELAAQRPVSNVRLVKRRLPGAGFFIALAPAK